MSNDNIEKAKNVLQIQEKKYRDFDACKDDVKLTRNPNEHRLLVHINGDKYEVGRVANAFPLSGGLRRVVFFNKKGEEIGILKKAPNLDEESSRLLRGELDKAYFMPVIEKITEITDHLGLELWKVLTNRGERTFEVRRPRKNVRSISHRRIIVKDVDGNRYEIRDWQNLDRKSIALLMRHL